MSRTSPKYGAVGSGGLGFFSFTSRTVAELSGLLEETKFHHQGPRRHLNVSSV